MPIVDQNSDAAYALLVAQAKRFPAFADLVKTAELDSNEKDTLPPSAFAWPEEKKFPIYDKTAAAVSYAYALAQAVPAPVIERIKEALDVFDIPGTTFDQPVTKIAAEEESYLLPDLKLFPVRDVYGVKTAQTKLLENISKLDLEHRATACSNLVKKAQELGVDLHPAMLQYAGFVVSSTKIASEWLDVRANLAKRPEVKAAYEKLAAGIRAQGPESRDRETLVKTASAVAELDKQEGLDRHYDRRLKDPLKSIFNTEKIAAQTVDICGKMVPISKLAALGVGFYRDLGGEELSREVAPNGVMDNDKLATVLATLPLDLRQSLAAYVR